MQVRCNQNINYITVYDYINALKVVDSSFKYITYIWPQSLMKENFGGVEFRGIAPES